MAELKGQEIFASGTHNGTAFTEADLDAIAKSFEALNLADRVPLKAGHDAAKPAKDGAPAWGWVKRVYREGSKLLADFSHVPERVMQLIRDKAYRYVSVELLKDVKAGTRTIPWTLDAVALLGADQPAVGSLKELGHNMSARMPLVFAGRMTFTRTTGGTDDMSEEVAALRAQLAASERRHHVEKLKGIVQTAINAKRVGAATMTSFSKYAGADDSESIMRFSAEDIEGWLKTCAPTDKMVQDGGRKVQMTTRVEQRVDDDGGDTGGETAGQQVVRFAAAVAAERGYPANWQQNQQQHLDVMATVQQRHPQVYATYVSEPWSLCG